ncbi:DUF1351 domain-containing protein [Marinobacterium sp. MBR-109]|jgi:hypothetical protein|uniref:DUF1351 domain-containing protein n=1 Tax=Marinobacterium sp. MBR-109 TaxID=3156462 RepID=UPI003398ECE2
MSAAEKLDVQTTDLVVISSTPAAIAFNYEETKAWLEQELKQYDVVVTAETLAGSKKLATELNKLASEISKRRREAVAEVSAPIKLFEDQAKSLEQMCKDGRQKLLDQVQVFEDETRAKAKAELERCRLEAWDHHGVSDEFRNAVINDLIKISALTKTGNLTAATANEVGNRVQADKQLQQQTEMRLLHLENQSYKAGLAAPLTRAHVEPFLFAPDDQYNHRLDAMLASELEREKVAQERMRQKMEAQAKADAERKAREEQQVAAEAERKQRDQVAIESAEATIPQPEQQQPEPEQPATPSLATATQKYAYGPLQDPRSAIVVASTLYDVERDALLLDQQPIGIWVPGQLIAIVYGDEVFRKV